MSLSNPFSALMTTAQDGPATDGTAKPANLNVLDEKVNNQIESVFLFTLNKDLKRTKMVYLEEISSGLPSKLFNFDLLTHAVFERLLLPNPQDFLIPNTPTANSDPDVAQTKGLLYLFQCYIRNQTFSGNKNDTVFQDSSRRIDEIILQNVATALTQPDLYEGQNFPQQLLDILQEQNDADWDAKHRFLSAATRTVMTADDEQQASFDCLTTTFEPVFRHISDSIKAASLITLPKWIFPTLNLFVQDKTNVHLAQLLLDYITPKAASTQSSSSGKSYSNTILGHLLNLSILPKEDAAPCEYFENPHDTSSNLKATLWDFMKIHLDSLHTLLKGFLLVGGEVRNGLLTWFGRCLHANAKRGQMWSRDDPGRTLDSSSDAFMINLTGVLLRLSQPLLTAQLKVLLVDPTYVRVEGTVEERAAKQVHMCEMDKETCLLPRAEGEETTTTTMTANKYNFITEVFFLTHKALDLGLRVAVDRLIELNRNIAEAQNMYRDLLTQPNGDQFLQLMTKQIQKFVSYLNTILGLANDGLLVEFYKATAVWLCQLVVKVEKGAESDAEKGYAPGKKRSFQLPLSAGEECRELLQSVPEFIVENIVGFFTFSRHFESEAIEIGEEAQQEIFTMILVFMGSAERVKNPHLRARLAEGLECLLPKRDAQSRTSYRNFTDRLFRTHEHRREIVPNLLRVFVGIEMTGQSVQFEQKFNYRRPMYAIMEYLWQLEEQKGRFRELAEEAERDIEAVDAPLFLRFVNLLINDAIFLLDESLNNLQQIRTLQEAESGGAWASMSTQEQQQQRNNMRHLGMITRFDNILGKDTINILVYLTTEIKGIFSHSSMVDRVAAMLNYFLLNLVGPKQGNFKVRNREEYDFHPAHTVRQICQIYVNLHESDSFCLAVSQDGRSYSHQLFQFAEQILVKIGGGPIGEMREVAEKVDRLDKRQRADQEALSDPPDEFLDPIMSTLMMDPVILPSSKVTVDRTTIARHLLSDQTDPFNRSPLTMDQVQGDVEMRGKIEQWIREKREAYSQQRQVVEEEEKTAED